MHCINDANDLILTLTFQLDLKWWEFESGAQQDVAIDICISR